jgi:glycosyltransferase involved in cell wall biosynthesis
MEEKKLFVFAASNSFLTLPPVKQLNERIKLVSDVLVIQSRIGDYEDFFKGATFYKIINNYDNYFNYHRQKLNEKIKKYIKIIYFFCFELPRFRKKYETVYIYSFELFIIWAAIIFKKPKDKIIYHQFELVDQAELNVLDRFCINRIKKNISRVDFSIFPELNRKLYFTRFLNKFNENQFYVLPNTNNNSPIDFLANNDKIIIAHIGALDLDTFITNLLETIINLPEKHFEFWFVGRISKDIKNMLADIPNKNVKIIDQLPHNLLQDLYQKIDIGLILYKDSTLNTKFCAPNKLYEYWSFGIPIIGHILPGLESVVKYDIQGYLINMNDSNQLGSTILKLGKKTKDKTMELQLYFQNHLKLDNFLNDLFLKLKIKKI